MHIMMLFQRAVFFGWLLSCFGCVAFERTVPPEVAVSSPAVVAEDRAIEIASDEARRRGWRKFVVGNAYLRQQEWYVHLYSDPPSLGGSGAVVVSAIDGSVVRYHGGR